MLGFQRRLFRRWEWLTRIPKDGCLPQISQTEAIGGHGTSRAPASTIRPMGVLDRLDHTHLRAAVVGFRDALRAHQDRLNRLNVYPVPDGDTGTNMALTLESVVTGLDGVSEPTRHGRAPARPSPTGRSWGPGATRA